MLICAGGYATTLLVMSDYWLSGIWTLLFTAIIFRNTIKLVSHSETKLFTFLQSLEQGDYSVSFRENKNDFDFPINNAFNRLNATFKKLREDKESQHQLLQLIVDEAAVPLICYDESNGDIHLTNEAAKKMLHISFMNNINSLKVVERSLLDSIIAIRDSEKLFCKIKIDGKLISLSVTSRRIIFREKSLKLIAMHDISSELKAKESETWRGMLKVLTHEISNSAIPLSTLSAYAYEMIQTADSENRKPDGEEWKDIREALKTIDERSKSLKLFVHNFKSVNQIPDPDTKKLPVADLLSETVRLFAKDLKDNNISLITKSAPKSPCIWADKILSMQVLINVTKNAIESMATDSREKVIRISIENDGPDFVHIQIADNGTGIPVENIDKIFIPFYSTKRGGSGIGLSISKQIMEKQKGDIFVSTHQGHGSVFTLRFPVAL
jgi:two-component system, NtrC family, nitrogen regulation sensor histidine kinase NtrY